MQITKNPSYYTWLPNFVRVSFSGLSAGCVWLFTPPRVFVTLIVLILAGGTYWATNNWTVVPRQSATTDPAILKSLQEDIEALKRMNNSAPKLDPASPRYQAAPVRRDPPVPYRDCSPGFHWDASEQSCIREATQEYLNSKYCSPNYVYQNGNCIPTVTAIRPPTAVTEQFKNPDGSFTLRNEHRPASPSAHRCYRNFPGALPPGPDGNNAWCD
jgi:hypothetical protein